MTPASFAARRRANRSSRGFRLALGASLLFFLLVIWLTNPNSGNQPNRNYQQSRVPDVTARSGRDDDSYYYINNEEGDDDAMTQLTGD